MITVEKEKNNFFKNIDFIFTKMKNLGSNESSNRAQILKQRQQADQFWNSQLYEVYFSMLDNGYTPTPQQEKKVEEHVSQLISYFNQNDNAQQLLKFVNQGYKFSTENAYHLVANQHFQHSYLNRDFFNLNINIQEVLVNKEKIIDKDFQPLLENLRNTVFTSQFANFAAKKWLGFLNSNDKELHKVFKKVNHKSVDDFGDTHYYMQYKDNNILLKLPFSAQDLLNIPKFLNYMPHIILPNIDMSQFVGLVTQWNKEKNKNISYVYKEKEGLGINSFMPNNFITKTDELFSTILKEHYSKDLKNMLNTTKMVFSEQYLETKTIEANQSLSNYYRVSSLPDRTKNTIKDIEKIYQQLEYYKEQLTSEDHFLVDNLFEKRIPEVLQKYFSINEEYRLTMTTSDGKNAQYLMDESLINFKDKMAMILTNVNENQLSELNVMKRYSQKI